MTRKSHFLPYFSYRLLAVLFLSGIFLIQPVPLSPLNIAQAESLSPSRPPVKPNPNQLRNLLKRLSEQAELKGKNFTIKDVTPQTWPDACLGLANPEEICAQMLVEGWRITVVEGKQTWMYRSNQPGTLLRLDTNSP